MNHDLRTTPENTSQRLLNAQEVGTHVPIHRHLKTSKTVICIEGCLDWVSCDELTYMPVGQSITGKQQQIICALPKSLASVSAPEKRSMAFRYRKPSGTPSKCMNPAPFSRRRTGRMENKYILPSYIPYLR